MVRAAKTLPWAKISSWGFEEKFGCCREGPALGFLRLGRAGCFPKDQLCQDNPHPTTGALLTSGSSRRGAGAALLTAWAPSGMCTQISFSRQCSTAGPLEGSALLPSASAPRARCSCVTLGLSLPRPVPVSSSTPSRPWVQDFPRPASVREDEELQIAAQISQAEAEGRFPPPETPQFLCPLLSLLCDLDGVSWILLQEHHSPLL